MIGEKGGGGGTSTDGTLDFKPFCASKSVAHHPAAMPKELAGRQLLKESKAAC